MTRRFKEVREPDDDVDETRRLQRCKRLFFVLFFCGCAFVLRGGTFYV